jgi:hypothetical protein
MTKQYTASIPWAAPGDPGAPETTFLGLTYLELPSDVRRQMVSAGVFALERYRESSSDQGLVEAAYTAMLSVACDHALKDCE